MGDKILLASFCIKYASITSESTELVILIFPQHKEGMRQIFGSLNYIEKKMIMKQLKKLGYYAQKL